MKRRINRIISSLLGAVMIMTAVPLNGFVGLKFNFNWLNFDWLDFATKSSAATTLDPTGQCGENVYWTFDSDTGLLTISGVGDMYHYCSSFENNRAIKNLVIESGVTSIVMKHFLNVLV